MGITALRRWGSAWLKWCRNIAPLLQPVANTCVVCGHRGNNKQLSDATSHLTACNLSTYRMQIDAELSRKLCMQLPNKCHVIMASGPRAA